MKLDIQAESVKAAPAISGTMGAVYAKVHDLDWATMAAQATVFYILLQALYLIWKWRKEAKDGTKKTD